MCAALEILGFQIFCKSSCHRRADTRADEYVERYAALPKSLVDSYMRASQAAASRSDKSDRATGQETDQTVDIDLVFKRDMVMHKGGQSSQPSGSAADFTASSVMNANETSRRHWMNPASESFNFRQICCGRISTARKHNHISLTDSFAPPCRSFASAEIDH
jgi:hypothetical protein